MEEHINEAYKALQAALSAIRTMEDEHLGRDHLCGYYYKDELIDVICSAQASLAEHMDHKVAMKLNRYDPFENLEAV